MLKRPLQKTKLASTTREVKVPRLRHQAAREALWSEDKPYVVRLLNMETNSFTKRLVEIVEACRRAKQLNTALKSSSAAESKAQRGELRKVMTDLNTRLSNYKWHPTLTAYTGTDFHLHLRYGFSASSHSAEEENRAVQWLMRHIEDIDRVRQCHRPQCCKWIFAKPERKKYCGANCRKRDAENGEDFKEKRRLYMQKYRKEEAERDARAKRLAKGKSK